MKLYNVKTVARLLGLTERRVRQLKDEGVLTEQRPGYYELEQAIHQYIQYLRDRQPNDEALDYYDEKAKLTKAKREGEEYDLALKRKELHQSEEIRLVMSSMLSNFKARMVAIPAKISPIAAKTKDETVIFELIKNNIDEALEELSDFDSAFLMEKSDE